MPDGDLVDRVMARYGLGLGEVLDTDARVFGLVCMT